MEYFNKIKLQQKILAILYWLSITYFGIAVMTYYYKGIYILFLGITGMIFGYLTLDAWIKLEYYFMIKDKKCQRKLN